MVFAAPVVAALKRLDGKPGSSHEITYVIMQRKGAMAEYELTLAGMSRQLQEMSGRLDARLSTIEGRLGGIEDQLHRFELRLERLDANQANADKRLGDLQGEMRAKLEGLENRVNTKAGNWVVSLWGATLAFLIGLLKLWP
jgi:chromosome segregation ATPase